MQHLDNKSSPLKDDLNDDRTLRSSSPAIKRPASDMGGKEREDVDMADDTSNTGGSSSTNAAAVPQPNNGKRQKSAAPEIHVSNPGAVAQSAPSEDSSVSDTTLPDTSRTSTAPTSIMGSADTTDTSSIPSIDEQIATVRKMILETPSDGDKGFCVSGRWLRRVLARGSDPEAGYDKSDLEGEIGPVDNSDIALVAEDSGTLKDEAGEIFTHLRPGLIVNEEMQVFPQAAWDMVIRLYGIADGSPVITRYAHDISTDKNNPQEVQWELHPPIHSFLKVIGTQTIQTQKDADLPPPRMVSSVHRPFMNWLKEAKEKLHVDVNTKVRVWRVISGLKSASASGILTPIASRSASPAPGAEIIANAGSKMIIDVNTFALLNIGDQRELIDSKDHTMDSKYNGKIELRTIGLGRGDVIVLEEQTPKNDEYPSENPRFTLKGAAKAKNLTVNAGRASPNPNMMTRGRAQREGKPKGIVGLQNLGNTCYMNSALQCIRSVDELTEYFRCGYYKKELNVNNPLGHHGEVAKAYGNFIDGIYAASHNTFTPNALKKVIGKYGMQFQGYGQQDSQEFLAFLLDGLQEDLNRIQKKPYIEKPDSTDDMVGSEKLLKEFADRNWNDYKARNDSVITDLFAGMYKSTLTCPVCDKVSIVFDPFSNLTLQLPIENNWAKEIIYFPLNEKPLRIDIDIDKHSSILDLKKFIAQRVGHDPLKMICAESYKNKFFKLFDNTEIIAETSINTNDVVCVYELSEVPTNYNADKKKKYSVFSYSSKDTDPKVDADSPAADQLLTPIYHRVAKPNGNNRMIRTYFGHPSYIVLSRQDRISYDGVFKKVLTQVVGMTSVDLVGDPTESSNPSEDSDTLLVDNDDGSQSPSASGKSVQDEDELVDVSMRDASQPPADGASRETAIQTLTQPGRPVPEKYLNLFDIHVVHTDDGVPTGWNSLNDSTDYESLKEKAKEMQRSLAHRPRRELDDEGYDTSTDDPADEQAEEQQNSTNSGSDESGASPREESDSESVSLPEATPVFTKDTRGASKHQKKKTYARKGKRIVGKAPQRPRFAVPAQPKVVVTNGNELVVPGDALILDWDPDAYEALFEGNSADTMRGELTHRDPELFQDEELVAKRASRLARKKNGVSLEDCLNEFGKTETLSEQNAWYCPRCKEHRRADKQFELWKVPDVLVMHLKRFSSARNFRDKLELKVEYPVEGLDLSTMVRDQSDGKGMMYDLIAVDNHYGGLGGGHYTAYAKNSVTGNWYDYNDSHVSQVKDVDSVVTKSAYLLFYRRRTDHPLGGPQLEQVLNEVNCEDMTTSRDGSPSGEGQRLGDSSHNGLSSALAGQAHRVGDGGSAVNRQKQQKSKDPFQDQEDEGHSIYHGHLSSSDAPPDYQDSSQDTMLLDSDDRTAFVGPLQPWSDATWSFDNAKAPPSSNVDEDEAFANQSFGRFSNARRNSNASNANASSTAGMGGSDFGNASDVANLGDLEDQVINFDDIPDQSSPRGSRESAPPPEVRLPQQKQKIFEVPAPTDEEDLEVHELRLDSEKPTSPSS